MSTARSQHAIDLGDIERQVRDASSGRQPKHPSQDDPLAELARIVSGEPVYRQEPRLELPRVDSKSWPSEFTPPSSQAHAPQQDTNHAEIEDDIGRLLRGEDRQSERAPDELEDAMRSLDELLKEREATMAQAATTPARLPKAESFPDWELRGNAATSPAAIERREPDFDFDSAFAEPAAASQSRDYAEWEQDASEPTEAPVTRSRRPIALVAAVVGVAALGVGAALSMKGMGGPMGDGRAPLIVADKGPSKVAPVNPGGMQIPDQNKQLFERSASAAKPPAKVVNNEEQPMDLREVVRRETGVPVAPAAASPATQTSSSTTDPGRATGVGAPEPRKVKTVVVKPPQPAPAAEPLPPPRPPAPAASPSAVGSIDAPPPVAASAPKAKAQGSLAASRETTASIRTTAPRPAAGAATQPAAPLQITPTNPPPQRTASVEPNPLAGSSAPTPPAGEVVASNPRPAAIGGGFVVQLASEGTEQSAKAAIRRLQSRYAELSSYSSSIQRREVNGQQRYRIRFGSMSRDGASTLCSALKGKGQDCLVQPQ